MTVRATWACVTLLGLTACSDPETFIPFAEAGGPAGVITGSVTYAGPQPCTRNGSIIGAAVLLGFEEGLLPPPEGLGTTPAALAVVAGEELFRGVRDQLSFDPDGGRVCVDAPIVASATFELGPVPAGVFQIRGFYDRDGDFNPTFSIFNLPTAGDIGGGAIENATEALLGAPVVYRGIEIGVEQDGRRVMPPQGDLVEGVAVALGLELPLERPVFHVRDVRDEVFGNEDPRNIVVPSDYQLTEFSVADPVATEASFVRLVLGAGVPADEQDPARGNPFYFPQNPSLFHSRQDVNLDGMIDVNDSIPESSLIPALLPLGVLTRLEEGNDLSAQRPSVILQGVTLLDNLLLTASAPVDLADARDELLLALRPAVLCIDTLDPSKDAVLVNTHPDDLAGNVLIPDPAPLEARLSEQFGRPVRIEYGCLPEGRYAMNLVYATGQAWTVPNEAGICAPAEADGGDTCGVRPKLRSQNTVVTIGPPTDPSYCEANPTPVACEAIP